VSAIPPFSVLHVCANDAATGGDAWDAADLAVAFAFAGCDDGTAETLAKYKQDIAGLLSFLAPFVREGCTFDKRGKAYVQVLKVPLVPFVFEAMKKEEKAPASPTTMSGMALKLSSDDDGVFGAGFTLGDDEEEES
jgi:hypothetical protein